MSRSPSAFRQRDVEAALRAARAVGLEVTRVEVDRDGKIVVVAAGKQTQSAEMKSPEEEPVSEWPVLPGASR